MISVSVNDVGEQGHSHAPKPLQPFEPSTGHPPANIRGQSWRNTLPLRIQYFVNEAFALIIAEIHDPATVKSGHLHLVCHDPIVAPSSCILFKPSRPRIVRLIRT